MPISRRTKNKGKQPNRSVSAPAYERITALLRLTRQRAGMSQVELAARLDRSQIYVSRCELGERRMDLLEWLEFMRGCRADPHVFISRMTRWVKLPPRHP